MTSFNLILTKNNKNSQNNKNNKNFRMIIQDLKNISYYLLNII